MHVCVHVWIQMFHDTYAEVRRQIVGVSFLFLPCGLKFAQPSLGNRPTKGFSGRITTKES